MIPLSKFVFPFRFLSELHELDGEAAQYYLCRLFVDESLWCLRVAVSGREGNRCR